MKKFLQFLVPVLLAALIVASIGWYLFIFDRNFTRDTLLKQARFYDLNGSSRISAWFYDMAYSFSDRDESVAIELANQYKESGNYTKAELTLTNAIYADATPELYTALSKTFVEQDKLMDAVALIANIPDPGIKAQLEAQRPKTPSVDKAPGFYNQYISLRLQSDGAIFYDMNGEFPSIATPAYDSPITLSAGETAICCIAVNADGLVSPAVMMNYTVGGVIEPAVFTDPNMEAAIRELLGYSSEKTIYTNALWDITEFTLPDTVTRLDDLALMPFLETLVISNKELPDLIGLSGLSKLDTLEIRTCHFPAADLAYIARLPELKRLTISDCGLSTISELNGADNLTYLDLSDNTLRNLEVISPMSNLQALYLQNNAVAGLEALSGLSVLETLDISHNAVTSLIPLATCYNLKWLNAAYNTIVSAEGLGTLVNLESLSLNFNALTGVEPLAHCSSLKELSFSNNSVSNLAPLIYPTGLEVLDFSYNLVDALPVWSNGCALRIVEGSNNGVSDLTPLSGISSLSYLSLEYNVISDVSPLVDCINLVQLNVYGNPIPDVSMLTDHSVIVNYDPTQ